MKKSLRTFIIGLLVFYCLLAGVTLALRISPSVWPEVGRFIITKWFLIPAVSLIIGIIGYILLKNIWIAAAVNFICCLSVMSLLYFNVSYADSTLFYWVKYSVIVFIVTFFSSLMTYFIKKCYDIKYKHKINSNLR